jgi:hypothetical protein
MNAHDNSALVESGTSCFTRTLLLACWLEHGARTLAQAPFRHCAVQWWCRPQRGVLIFLPGAHAHAHTHSNGITQAERIRRRPTTRQAAHITNSSRLARGPAPRCMRRVVRRAACSVLHSIDSWHVGWMNRSARLAQLHLLTRWLATAHTLMGRKHCQWAFDASRGRVDESWACRGGCGSGCAVDVQKVRGRRDAA